jgi:hypothetical protein
MLKVASFKKMKWNKHTCFIYTFDVNYIMQTACVIFSKILDFGLNIIKNLAISTPVLIIIFS